MGNIHSTVVTLYKFFRTSAEVKCGEKNAAEVLGLVPIHVLAGRAGALDAFRYMDTNARKQSQLSQQNLRARIKVPHVEFS